MNKKANIVIVGLMANTPCSKCPDELKQFCIDRNKNVVGGKYNYSAYKQKCQQTVTAWLEEETVQEYNCGNCDNYTAKMGPNVICKSCTVSSAPGSVPTQWRRKQ